MGRNACSPIEIEARDVSIASATVSLKTVQVDKRQMTQSVFRQLPSMRFIDQDRVEIIGVVWGWVNYSCGAEQRQFLVQFNGKLWRCEFLMRRTSWGMMQGGLGMTKELGRLFERGVQSEIEDYCRRWDAMVDYLASVDQLFIAC